MYGVYDIVVFFGLYVTIYFYSFKAQSQNFLEQCGPPAGMTRLIPIQNKRFAAASGPLANSKSRRETVFQGQEW
jgi:hypothetical protein